MLLNNGSHQLQCMLRTVPRSVVQLGFNYVREGRRHTATHFFTTASLYQIILREKSREKWRPAFQFLRFYKLIKNFFRDAMTEIRVTHMSEQSSLKGMCKYCEVVNIHILFRDVLIIGAYIATSQTVFYRTFIVFYQSKPYIDITTLFCCWIEYLIGCNIQKETGLNNKWRS